MSRRGVEACDLSARLLAAAGKANRHQLERLAAVLGVSTHSRQPLHLLAADVARAIREENRGDDEKEKDERERTRRERLLGIAEDVVGRRAS